MSAPLFECALPVPFAKTGILGALNFALLIALANGFCA